MPLHQQSTIINFILNQSNKRQLFVFVLLIDEMKWWVDWLLPPHQTNHKSMNFIPMKIQLICWCCLGLQREALARSPHVKWKDWFVLIPFQTIQLFNHSSLNWFALLVCLLLGGAIGCWAAHNPLREQTTKGKSINSTTLRENSSSSFSLIIKENEGWTVLLGRWLSLFISFSTFLPIRKRRKVEWKKRVELRCRQHSCCCPFHSKNKN